MYLHMCVWNMFFHTSITYGIIIQRCGGDMCSRSPIHSKQKRSDLWFALAYSVSWLTPTALLPG